MKSSAGAEKKWADEIVAGRDENFAATQDTGPVKSLLKWQGVL